MRNTQIKIAQYIGSLYGGDIMGELETKKEFVAAALEYPKTAQDRKAGYETMIRAQQQNILGRSERARMEKGAGGSGDSRRGFTKELSSGVGLGG
jgi:hypothetical protein